MPKDDVAKAEREELEGHAIDSNEEISFDHVEYTWELEADAEEDGCDVATHGGGELEDVPGFESDYALLEGFEPFAADDVDSLEGPVNPCCDDFPMPESVCGRDDRVRITGTTRIPWRLVCKLVMTFKDGARGGCTGWLIGPRTVMTAGHCIYSHSHGGWAEKVEVIPGMNGSSKPFGSQVARWFFSVKGWTKSKKPTHDYGAIILPNDKLGRRLGWFGFAALSNSSLRNLLVNNSGYAGDKPYGTQWFNAGRITHVESRRLKYMIDTAGGHSGSPTWRLRKGQRHGVGIHAYGGCPNASTRITKPVFDNMKRWKYI